MRKRPDLENVTQLHGVKKFETLDSLPHTFSKRTYYIKQEYVKKKKSLMKHQAFLRGVIDSKFNCNFYSAAPVYGASCVIGNRAKLVLLSKGPLFTATAKVMTSATATAF